MWIRPIEWNGKNRNGDLNTARGEVQGVFGIDGKRDGACFNEKTRFPTRFVL